MRICVLGGTGTIGRLVVAELRERQHAAAPLSRKGGVDALTGAGLVEAIAGADAVVSCLNIPTVSAGKAITFFSATARNAARAVLEARVPHLVDLSILGVERPDVQAGYGYYRGKAAEERTLSASGAPVTLVKTAQWFELTETLLAARVGTLSVVPRFPSQPMAAAAAAAVLADVVEAGPGGPTRLAAGPEPRDLADLAATVGARRIPRQRVLRVQLRGAAGRMLRSGALLPGPDVPRLGPTFEEWLEHR
ncbi:NAD(P)H-binding protein [Amnibacterium sp. CER49]|uniref:SDR family oxidoreductase n=1 Tax=Amnibacterium sp. CER49 TaxID=3039161 RepID=UPI002447718F|nr:NAD(P)H-binding protein [Amnibacterium sp. CER49]MDH2444908.1 NAD(P)H-binding protein [Amnibacterium sp. CER49]